MAEIKPCDSCVAPDEVVSLNETFDGYERGLDEARKFDAIAWDNTLDSKAVLDEAVELGEISAEDRTVAEISSAHITEMITKVTFAIGEVAEVIDGVKEGVATLDCKATGCDLAKFCAKAAYYEARSPEIAGAHAAAMHALEG